MSHSVKQWAMRLMVIFKLLVVLSSTITLSGAFADCAEELLRDERQTGLTAGAAISRRSVPYPLPLSDFPQAAKLPPLARVPRSLDQLKRLSLTHDLAGKHAVEIPLDQLSYGKHMALIAVVDGRIRIFTVPEFNVANSLRNDQPDPGFVGSHEGLIAKALGEAKDTESVGVIASLEIWMGPQGLAWNLYGRSGTYPGTSLEQLGVEPTATSNPQFDIVQVIESLPAEKRAALHALELQRLQIAWQLLEARGLRTNRLTTATTFIELPEPPKRHAGDASAKTEGIEALLKLAVRQMDVERKPHLLVVRSLLLEFYAMVVEMVPPSPKDSTDGMDSRRRHISSLVELVWNYGLRETNNNPVLDDLRAKARRNTVAFGNILGDIQKFEIDGLIASYDSPRDYRPFFLLERVLDILSLWQARGPGVPVSPFTAGQLVQWRTFENKVRLVLEEMKRLESPVTNALNSGVPEAPPLETNLPSIPIVDDAPPRIPLRGPGIQAPSVEDGKIEQSENGKVGGEPSTINAQRLEEINFARDRKSLASLEAGEYRFLVGTFYRGYEKTRKMLFVVPLHFSVSDLLGMVRKMADDNGEHFDEQWFGLMGFNAMGQVVELHLPESHFDSGTKKLKSVPQIATGLFSFINKNYGIKKGVVRYFQLSP